MPYQFTNISRCKPFGSRGRIRYTLMLMVLTLLLLGIAGCEKGAKLKIYNRTSYPVYAGALGEAYTIPADSVLSLDISTSSTSIFNPDVGKYVTLDLVGETYQIWDSFLEAFVDSTYVWVDAGETTKVYIDPNRASVKVLNHSTQWIKKIIISRGTLSGTLVTGYDVYLGPGAKWFKQVPPADPSHNYYYIVQVQFENDDIISFGSNTNVLHVDEQFLVTVPVQE